MMSVEMACFRYLCAQKQLNRAPIREEFYKFARAKSLTLEILIRNNSS